MKEKFNELRHQVDLAYWDKKGKILECNDYEKNMDNKRKVGKIVAKWWQKGVNS
jgi:hypothetical protein